MKKRLTVLALVLSMAVGTLGCGGSKETGTADTAGSAETSSEAASDTDSEESFKLRLAIQQGGVSREESAEVTWSERFKEEVEAGSNGRITVEIYPSAQLGSQEENLTSLVNGSLEMAILNSTVLNSVSPRTMLLACPALFSDEQQCDTVLAGEWGQQFWDDVAEESGVRVIGAYCNGMRSFTTSTKPLTTVDTAKGVTFRVMPSAVYEKMVEAIGANPVPMPGSEMYTAMQNGTVDGQENPPVNILNDKTYEVQKYMVLDKHVASVGTLCLADSVWQSMPEDLQQVVADAAATATAEGSEVSQKLNDNGVEQLKEYGMEVYEPTADELEAWHEAMRQPCVDYVKGEIGDELVDGLLTAIDAVK